MTVNRVKNKRAVGVFPNRRDAEHVIHELRNSGFSMHRVSLIARHAKRNTISNNQADEGATVGALSGGAFGGITGLLVGLGTLALPGIGPLMLAGATATAIATVIAGSAIGAVAGSLLGALIGLGIPEEQARVYNERIARGDYLVMVEGTDEEIARAKAILSHRGIEDYGVYDAPDVDRTRTDYAPTTTPTLAPTLATPGVTGTVFGKKNAIGYFAQLPHAESALYELRAVGFPSSQVSLIANNFSRRLQLAGVALSDRFNAMSLGLPEEHARFYNDRVMQGEYVVIVNGTDDEIHRAGVILGDRGIQEWQIYDPTRVNSASVDDSTTSPALEVTASDRNRVNRSHTAAVTTDAYTTHPASNRSDLYDTPRVSATRTPDSVQDVSEYPDVLVIDRRNQTV